MWSLLNIKLVLCAMLGISHLLSLGFVHPHLKTFIHSIPLTWDDFFLIYLHSDIFCTNYLQHEIIPVQSHMFLIPALFSFPVVFTCATQVGFS